MDKGKGKGKVDYDYESSTVAGGSHGGKPLDMGKEVWQDDVVSDILIGSLSLTGRSRETSLLFGMVPRPQMNDQRSEVLPDQQEDPTHDVDAGRGTNNLEVQTQIPTQTINEESFLELQMDENPLPAVPEGTTSDNSEAPNMSLEDNNVTAAELEPLEKDADCEDNVSGSSAGSSPHSSGAPENAEQDHGMAVATKNDAGCLPAGSSSRSAPRSSSGQDSQVAAGVLTVQSDSSSRRAPLSFAEMVALQQGLVHAWFDPDQQVPYKLLHKSIDDLKNHYAADVEKVFRNPRNAFAPGAGRVSTFFQIQHPDSGLNSMNPDFQSILRQIKYPANHSIRLINVKGHVLGLSVDPYGSRFVQQKLGIATTGETMMVYKEITPHVLALAVDGFANYVIQKLLDHGPAFCKNELVANLLGHVFRLSLDLYGCRVIQKAFEVSQTDLQIEMAKELDANILKCVYDQHANHVVQKCIECAPPQHIQFMYRSLRGKAKTLSYHPYGCHIVQKALEFCNDPTVFHAFVMEIVECVNELSAHQFGNYVVQHILEHAGAHDRQIILLRFAGRIVQMSHYKFSSNVIEKCLVHGSYHDRQMITTEILRAGAADHLLSMMVHQYANYVVQKMLETANEFQFNMIVEVVRRNAGMLNMYLHGRHVIAHVERLLSARAGFVVSLSPHIAS